MTSLVDAGINSHEKSPTGVSMSDDLMTSIEHAVRDWAGQVHIGDEIIVRPATLDEFDEDNGDRYLVDFAVRSVGHWHVAEVWVADGQILDVNDIGEGLPLDDAEWPWAADR